MSNFSPLVLNDHKENENVGTPRIATKRHALCQRLGRPGIQEHKNSILESSVPPDVVRSTEQTANKLQDCTQLQRHTQTYCTPLRDETSDKISPGLTRLRMTPGVLREKQRRLISQHDEIRQKGDQLKTGGGVSLWPHMVQMRLTRPEICWLALQACLLSVGAIGILHRLHGDTFWKLSDLAIRAEQFCHFHQISERSNQTVFQMQITDWHVGFLHLTNIALDQFTVRTMSRTCQLYSLTYVVGMGMLVYYLLDNMLAHNKLTPSRIKKWTCLLVVIASWTAVMGYGLLLARQLEGRLVECVQRYSTSLAELVTSPLELNTYQAVLLYWRSRLLDDASPGVLSVLGVVPVRHVIHYLQFYSVPIVTVIVSPVLKLCWACVAVYRTGEYVRSSSSS